MYEVEVLAEDVSDYAVDWDDGSRPEPAGDLTAAIQAACVTPGCSSTVPSGPGRPSQVPTVPVPRSELADAHLMALYREKREALRTLELVLEEAGLEPGLEVDTTAA